MKIKYFSDTDTLYVAFNENEVEETKDIEDHITVDLDKDGNLVAMTIEHANQYTNLDEFSFQKILSQQDTVL